MTEADNYVHPKRAQTVANVMAVLPATKVEIAQRSGLHRKTVFRVIEDRHEAGKVHIGAWRPHPIHGPPMAVYHAGPGKDVPDTLPRLTKKQISDRHEKRIKGTEKHDQRKARDRSRHWVKKAKAAPQGIFAALGLQLHERK